MLRRIGWLALALAACEVTATPIRHGATAATEDASSDAGTVTDSSSATDGMADAPADLVSEEAAPLCTPPEHDASGATKSWQCVANIVKDADAGVNIGDLGTLLKQQGCAVGAGDAECDASDLDGDCRVDGDDIVIYQVAAGAACGDAGSIPAAWVCIAELDANGIIDAGDVAWVQGQTGCGVGTGLPACDASDLDGDNVVDDDDQALAEALAGHVCF